MLRPFAKPPIADVPREFVVAWVDAFNERIATFAAIVAFAYYFLALPIIPITAPPEQLSFAMWIHVIVSAISAVALIARFRWGKSIVQIVLWTQVLGTLLLCKYTSDVLKTAPSPDHSWVAVFAGTAVTGMLIIAVPIQSRRWWFMAAYNLIAVGVTLTILSEATGFMLIVSGFVASTFTLLKFLLTLAVHREAAKEYLLKEAVRKQERQKIQIELDLAHQIHASVKMPPTLHIQGGLRLDARIVRHSEIGGDWLGAHQFGGRTLIGVADASGKGIQAALVIHALQSLWMSAINRPQLDVKAWVWEVNSVMARLGETAAHTLSMGLLDIWPDRIEAWEMGHVPLLFVKSGGSFAEPVTRKITPRGNILGISTEFEATPEVIARPERGDVLLWGTDGVLTAKVLRLGREWREFYADFATLGLGLIDSRGDADDRALIVLRAV